MKITLDLTALVASGALTEAEADRLQRLAARQTSGFGSTVLLGFGVVAVALGAFTLLPTAQTAIVVGGVLSAAGAWLSITQRTQWEVLGRIITAIGALGVVGGLWALSDGSIYVSLGMAAGLATGAALAQSGLLAALSILMLGAALGASTAYWSASYFLGVERPALTIGVLSATALGLYLVSLRVPPAYERLAIIGARTAILLVNVAFLVGSLFGDQLVGWPDWVFSIGWAVAILGVGGWAVYANRRWVVNVAAVFGAIHFYTQWFETLGPNQVSILGGGLILIVFGLALARFNNWLGNRLPPVPSA